MSRGINKAILVGNAGKDPEVRYTQGGTAVATFSLATTERRKGTDGQWTDHTEWHNLVAWGKTAETCGNYVKKGNKLYVEGRIQSRKWQDKDGNNRYTTEIVVNQLLLLDRAPGGQRPAAAAGGPAAYGGGSDTFVSPSPRSSGADEFPGAELDDPPFDPNDDVPF